MLGWGTHIGQHYRFLRENKILIVVYTCSYFFCVDWRWKALFLNEHLRLFAARVLTERIENFRRERKVQDMQQRLHIVTVCSNALNSKL